MPAPLAEADYTHPREGDFVFKATDAVKDTYAVCPGEAIDGDEFVTSRRHEVKGLLLLPDNLMPVLLSRIVHIDHDYTSVRRVSACDNDKAAVPVIDNSEVIIE